MSTAHIRLRRCPLWHPPRVRGPQKVRQQGFRHVPVSDRAQPADDGGSTRAGVEQAGRGRPGAAVVHGQVTAAPVGQSFQIRRPARSVDLALRYMRLGPRPGVLPLPSADLRVVHPAGERQRRSRRFVPYGTVGTQLQRRTVGAEHHPAAVHPCASAGPPIPLRLPERHMAGSADRSTRTARRAQEPRYGERFPDRPSRTAVHRLSTEDAEILTGSVVRLSKAAAHSPAAVYRRQHVKLRPTHCDAQAASVRFTRIPRSLHTRNPRSEA